MTDYSQMADHELQGEFDRAADERDDAEAKMAAIRAEQSKRRDAEIAELRAKVGR